MNNQQDRNVLGLFSLISIIALTYLFQSFLLVLIFAAIYAIGTYPIFMSLNQKYSRSISALLLTILTLLLVILPLIYLVSVSAIALTRELPSFLATINNIDFELIQQKIIIFLNQYSFLSGLQTTLTQDLASLNDELKTLIIQSSQVLINLSSLILASFSGIFSLFLFIFILFFFYKDGYKIAEQCKNLLPTSTHLSEKISVLLESLCSIYLVNVIALALIQGFGFGLVSASVNLPAYYLGLLFVLSSFIPVIGSMIIWVPTAIYLFILNQDTSVMIVIFYSVVISGGLIDYWARAKLIDKLSYCYPNQNLKQSSLVIILSTLAGVIEFGVLGLILGPLVASTALGLISFYLQTKNEYKPS